MNISLSTRIGLCILSGTSVALVQIYDQFIEDLGGTPAFYGVSGLLFAAGVLLPYLKRDNSVIAHALALVIASTVSYYSAVWLALDGPFADDSGWISFTIASVAGAAIVLTAVASMTPDRASRAFVVFGLLAGFAGGPVTYFTLPSDGYLILLGHASWHTLICLAIYFGTGSTKFGAELAAE